MLSGVRLSQGGVDGVDLYSTWEVEEDKTTV